MTYKTFILGTALVAVAAGSAFAQSTSQSRPPGEPARTQTTDQNRTASGDQAFVSKMAGVNMAEVELGMMAKDKASGKDVKAFAQRMIDDHRKANE